MATTFPTSLQDLDATRGTASQTLDNPSHVTHHALEDDTLEALQTKLGINSSAVTTSVDYLLKNTSSSDPGHKHTLANGATNVTSSATELNILDGATLDVIELNYVDGVTSPIQTQLDAKGAGDFLADGTVAMTGDLNLNGSNIDNGGVVFLIEQVAADVDVIGSGQLWVLTATPNVLMFTDDAGTDFTVAHNATTTLSSLASIGTITTGTWSATDIAVAAGGTGKSSWTQWLIPYADTTTSFSQIAIGTSGQVLPSNGAGAAPTFETIASGTAWDDIGN